MKNKEILKEEMVIIPKEYYEKEIEVKLTQAEINVIIEALEFQPHNLFEFLNCGKIVKKLKNEK